MDKIPFQSENILALFTISTVYPETWMFKTHVNGGGRYNRFFFKLMHRNYFNV